jgi:large subunit ribosomal protein L23
MKDPRTVIVKPCLTEKVNTLVSKENVYTFKVAMKSTKKEIKDSVEELFKVHVIEVRTMNYLGKPKRRGRFQGLRPSFKKALVKLNSGESIPVFEGL